MKVTEVTEITLAEFGGGGGNRTHVQSIIYRRRYVCSLDILVVRRDHSFYIKKTKPECLVTGFLDHPVKYFYKYFSLVPWILFLGPRPSCMGLLLSSHCSRFKRICNHVLGSFLPGPWRPTWTRSLNFSIPCRNQCTPQTKIKYLYNTKTIKLGKIFISFSWPALCYYI